MCNYLMADPETPLPQGMPDAERFFKLGMMCSTGQSVPLDMVSAHKWFNIAGLRNEIAAELSSREIALAQRAARQWRTQH